MKTKMKTKLVLWICALTVIFAACSKSESQDPLDCMRVENGLAVLDDCGECHQSYMYMPPGQVTSVATFADTVGVDGMFIAAGSATDIASNPYWNACADCMGIINGGAVARGDSCYDCNGILDGLSRTDDCDTCHQSYMYEGGGVLTHIATLADTAGLEGALILAGSALDIANNPYWITNCDSVPRP